jgi:regulatory protein
VTEGERAKNLALKLLARRDHSEAELVRKLEERGLAGTGVAELLATLRAQGYLDDRRFALRWAELAVAGGRGFGPRLRFELSRRGIPGEIIVEVLERIAATHDEEETLSALMASKFPRFDPERADPREKLRVFRYLQRRGFSPSAIHMLFRNGHEG